VCAGIGYRLPSGRDEFMILLPEAGGAAAVEHLAQKIIAAMEFLIK